MTTNNNLTDTGLYLQGLLYDLDITQLHRESGRRGQKIHVGGVGAVLSTAYEQLRNAAEYTEEHLLLQRTIRRFLVRNVSFDIKQAPKNISEELTVELTQSGYLINNSITTSQVEQLDLCINNLYKTYWGLQDAYVSREKSKAWTLDLLSVKCEQIINDTSRLLAFAHFAHNYFSKFIDWEDYTELDEPLTAIEQQKVLYIAVHKALLKSDDANIRTALMELYDVPLSDADKLAVQNTRLNELIKLETTKKINPDS